MPATFSRTLRAVDAERGRSWRSAIVLAGLLGAWVLWFFFGQVRVYEITDRARLEVENRVHSVVTPVGGRVVENRLVLAREVAAGEVVVVLDGAALRLSIEEKQSRCQALAKMRQAVREEIRAEQQGGAVQLQAQTAAGDEDRALIGNADVRARIAKLQSEVARRLRNRNAVSAEEYARALAEVEGTGTSLEAQKFGAVRRQKEWLVLEGERLVRLAKLERQDVELEGELTASVAAIRILTHDLDRLSIRAPVAGRIGVVEEFPPGSVVGVGEKLGAVVPPGTPRVVAQCPVAAAGRLRPGQPAQLRLDGFPWAQYGTLKATVDKVAIEPSENSLRVELDLMIDPGSPIPLGHGLPGTAEIEVDRVSPAVLLLRAAGRLAPARRTSAPAR